MSFALPDDVWIFILRRYISLEDRIKNVQLVNKHMHDLCWSSLMTKVIHFDSSVFMSPKLCLKIVRRAKMTVTTMSFRGCHWFPGTMFKSLPVLSSLTSLDLAHCPLTGKQLYHLFRKAPNLKNLAFSASTKEVESLFQSCENASAKPFFNLSKLHIHFCDDESTAYSSSTNMDRSDLLSMFFTQPQLQPVSLSVDLNRGNRWFFNRIGISSELNVDCGETIFFRSGSDERQLCKFLHNFGLHEQVANENSSTSNNLMCDKSKMRLLRLPCTRKSYNSAYLCNASKAPKLLPSLEVLDVDIEWKDTSDCYDLLKQNILLNCEIPSLKYLRVTGGSWPNMSPVDLYCNLSKLANLEDLDVLDSDVKVSRLVEEARVLNLKSLSFDLRYPICGHGGCIGGIDDKCSTKLVSSIVSSFPRLTKLEIRSRSRDPDCRIFSPLSALSGLEYLSLEGFDVVDNGAFAKLLKNFIHLRSFSLIYLRRNKERCGYEELLRDGLRFLPNLTELRLMNDNLKFFLAFEEIVQCKRLEKVAFEGCEEATDYEFENFMSPGALLSQFQSAMHALPRLHMLAVMSPLIYDDSYFKIKEYGTQLRKRGRGVEVYCGFPGNTLYTNHSRNFPPLLQRLIRPFSMAGYSPCDILFPK